MSSIWKSGMSSEGSMSIDEDLRHGLCLNRFSFRELGDDASWMMMGQAERHPITGRVTTADKPEFRNFTLVDLFSRRTLSDKVATLRQDKYVFLPVPLKGRTWLYHEDFRLQLTLESDENAMIKTALRRNCIDAPMNSGRWSPMMAAAPLAIGVALADDMVMLFFALFMLLCMQLLSEATNSVNWYQLLRPISCVPRIAFYIAVLARLSGGMAGATGLNLLGFAICLISMGADIILGDLRMLTTVNLIAQWEIQKILPKRLFICQRVGAMSYEERFGDRGNICEEIAGFAPWGKDLALIVDLHGVLVELRPIPDEMWGILFEQSSRDEEINVLGLDVFNKEFPTLYDIEAEQERHRAPRSPKGSSPKSAKSTTVSPRSPKSARSSPRPPKS